MPTAHTHTHAHTHIHTYTHTHTFACARQETLRYYSVVPVVTREAAADDTLGGVTVPRGCKIFIHIGVSRLALCLLFVP